MPTRRTLRGADRTPLGGDHDVLSLRSELRRPLRRARARRQRRARARARPLRDRRAPDRLRHPDRLAARARLDGRPPADVRAARRAHAPRDVGARASGRATSIRLPGAVPAAVGAVGCLVRHRQGQRAQRQRGPHRPWRPGGSGRRRRARLAAGVGQWLPAARCAAVTRASRCIQVATATRWEMWIDRRYVPAGYGWSFPAADELRIGVGSCPPPLPCQGHTELLAEDLGRDPVRYQGNWISQAARGD